MPTVKLNLEFQGRDCEITCNYEWPEAQSMNEPAVDEDLIITKVDMEGYLLLGEQDGQPIDRLSADEYNEICENTWEKFAEFMAADEAANYDNDTVKNPFGSWI